MSALEAHHSERTHQVLNWLRKATEFSLGFGMFEWLFIQVFKDNIGFRPLEGWIIGIIVNIVFVALALKYEKELIASMFDEED